ncbi:hypothetical protein, partial [Halopseudomonas aestusnigri]|uniref:hypothetical protein n=1 Tax=Halopseudomonas aestusnigri TaxID=857252 RepID=UPI001C0EF4A2
GGRELQASSYKLQANPALVPGLFFGLEAGSQELARVAGLSEGPLPSTSRWHEQHPTARPDGSHAPRGNHQTCATVKQKKPHDSRRTVFSSSFRLQTCSL